MCKEEMLLLCRGDRTASGTASTNIDSEKEDRCDLDSTTSLTMSIESFDAFPTSEELANLIERFRKQYFHVSGLLRERPLCDPCPSVDPVWNAAGRVARYGYYRPCLSYEVDYQNALAEWCAKQRRREEAEARKLVEATVACDRNFAHRMMQLPASYSWEENNGGRYPAPPPPAWAETLYAASLAMADVSEKAANAVLPHILARKHGKQIAKAIKAYEDAKAAKNTDSSFRGRWLFGKAKVREHARMLKDYACEDEETSYGSFDDVSVQSSACSTLVEESPRSEMYTHVHGTYHVENGQPMAKRESIMRLYDYMTGS